MQFDERDEGDFRIYAGALDAPRGDGFIAAVIVKRIGASGPAVFRDECLSGGHRWPSADEALQYALSAGRKALRAQQPERAAC